MSKSYRIKMVDGSEKQLDNVVRARADGSGRHFELEDGDVISYGDGQTLWAEPVTVVTTPAPSAEPPAEPPAQDPPADDTQTTE